MRNWAFEHGILKTYRSRYKVISVGNLSTGGTGKTPFIEFLILKLRNQMKLGILSRGYGRKTRGYLMASEKDSVLTLGDEPFQIYKKFKGDVLVAVHEKRASGLQSLEQSAESVDTVLLDDAFQHRYAERDLDILLTSFDQLLISDFVLPTGNLREPRLGAKRADMLIITKTPDSLPALEKKNIISRMSRFVDKKSIYFSSIVYEEPILFNQVTNELGKNQCYAMSGIAYAMPFIKFLGEERVIHHFDFPDHYAFEKEDLDKIDVKISKNPAPIITTEKDMVRLLDLSEHEIFKKYPCYYLPISLEMDREHDFMNELLKSLKGVKS